MIVWSTFRGGDKLRGADGFGLEVVVDGVTFAEFTGVRQHQIISCSLVVEGGGRATIMSGEIDEACTPFNCKHVLGVAAVIDFGLTRPHSEGCTYPVRQNGIRDSPPQVGVVLSDAL